MINTSLIEDRSRIKKNTNGDVVFFSAIVEDIILSKEHPKYNIFGGNNSIGAIIYKLFNSNQTRNSNSLSYAIPLFSSNKSFPIKGEIVLVVAGLPTKVSQKKDSFTVNYYISDVNVLNNAFANVLNPNLTKNESQSNILPKNGDVVTEGRFNNSLKFSSDDNGNPITILRNGSQVPNPNGDFRKENFDEDDSIIVFSTKTPYKIDYKFDELKSFNAFNDKSLREIKEVKITENILDSKLPYTKITDTSEEIIQKEVEEEIVDFENNETFDEGTTLDEIIQDENASIITQNKFVEVIKGRSLSKLSNPPNFNNSLKFIGFVDSSIPNSIRAMMDVIAYCEGTLGLNKHNGYDTVVLNCRTISGWNDNYLLGCPYSPVYSKNGSLFQYGGHWGRYQYQKSTWKLDNSGINVPFSKKNQDITCSKTMLRRLGDILFNNLHRNMQELGGVDKIVRKLAPEWASIPNGNYGGSYYRNQNVRLDGLGIQKLYNIAYEKYSKGVKP
jgi:muramidase (phage lysozyme)